MRTSTLALVLALAAPVVLAACGGGAGSADAAPEEADAEVTGGTFSASWMLSDGTNPIGCADVGAALVRYTFLPTGGNGNGFVGVFNCTDGAGTSERHDPGTFEVDVQLKDSFGHVLASGPHVSGVNIVEGGNTPLEPVTFTVSSLTGGLRASLRAAGAFNCQPEPNGAGLTGMRVELQTPQGACIPTAFSVAEGQTGTPAQEIAAGCPGALSPCIENDQLVTATGIPAGTYLLAVDGFEGGSTTAACYRTTVQVSISGAGIETNVGTVALPISSDLDAGCIPP